MRARDELPDGLEDLTPEWLSAALHEGDHLPAGVRVKSVRCERIGDGVGFVGALGRLHLEYDADAPGAPRTLVAKLPTKVGRSRDMAEYGLLYERELRFYTEVAPGLPLRTPRLYFAGMQSGLTPAQLIRRQRFIERLPYVLMAIVILVLAAFTGRFRRRRYVLLLEDVSHAQLTDQLAGCDFATARHAVEGLARAHAHRWNAPNLRELGWLPVLDENRRSVWLTFKLSRTPFEKRFSDVLAPGQLELLAWLDAHFIELANRLCSGPITYCHGDYRLANMFREDAGVIALDWQTSFAGPGAYDLAYFLTSSFPNPVEGEIEELRRLYHATLCASGVHDYDWASFDLDYRRVVPLCLGVLVLILNTLDPNDPKLGTLVRAWLDRYAFHIRGLDADALLA